ncbi:CPBP family intramembrane glutamic endopeptidase [Tessaracoccus sp. ZS01]|uniref:CPBP family intramembrane glutamic endopeptidase n=1 Tax=Tessaracoccus sp. ZS01 TaxID=1906324 RepID=UPI00096C2E3A|nr:CPBP family intramembrane glutamic endopeptidase [Tessaracoccus sp. ZS01]MCG6567758.1 CPBP family intramembrane metalloprotease [Tessaracoccus sp. ZS01]OMG55503.1 CAAX protease family protein [Tessaracoccus sp. ZS01]
MTVTSVPRPGLQRLRTEIVVVLLISLGQSAVYALLSIINKLTRPEPLAQQVTRMNTSTTPDRPWLDLAYQLAGLIFPLMPVVLVLFLLAVHHRPAEGPWRVMGFDLRRPGFDLVWGFGVFAVIGVAGLAFFIFALQIGINTQVQPANLADNWWTVPMLLARAVMNGVLEEVVMVGYLFTRWAQRGGQMWVILVVSAVIRGGYHLYQGFGGFIGNLVMGLVFGWLYLKIKRVMPLVVVHTLLDIVAFLGAPLLPVVMGWVGL